MENPNNNISHLTSVSYLTSERLLNVRMNNITPDKLTINQIIPTIREMYFNGARDIDNKWREAIKIYANKHNIKFAPGMINELFNILNNI